MVLGFGSPEMALGFRVLLKCFGVLGYAVDGPAWQATVQENLQAPPPVFSTAGQETESTPLHNKKGGHIQQEQLTDTKEEDTNHSSN